MVAIDPGKEDLIYCVDSACRNANVFRYSQNMCRKETKMKKYRNIILAMENEKIGGKTEYGILIRSVVIFSFSKYIPYLMTHIDFQFSVGYFILPQPKNSNSNFLFLRPSPCPYLPMSLVITHYNLGNSPPHSLLATSPTHYPLPTTPNN